MFTKVTILVVVTESINVDYWTHLSHSRELNQWSPFLIKKPIKGRQCYLFGTVMSFLLFFPPLLPLSFPLSERVTPERKG